MKAHMVVILILIIPLSSRFEKPRIDLLINSLDILQQHYQFFKEYMLFYIGIKSLYSLTSRLFWTFWKYDTLQAFNWDSLIIIFSTFFHIILGKKFRIK